VSLPFPLPRSATISLGILPVRMEKGIEMRGKTVFVNGIFNWSPSGSTAGEGSAHVDFEWGFLSAAVGSPVLSRLVTSLPMPF
jgi:hypothetical protein